MDYWISNNNVQTGPHSLKQLQRMWQEGHVTSTTYYYDGTRGEWQFVKTLLESVRQLFTVEEAFVRLGQNRQRGCLMVFNRQEYIQIFVEAAFVIAAQGGADHGEIALARALRLEDSSYEWFLEAKPQAANMRVNIPEYALKNSIARDIRIGSAATRKHNTVTIPKNILDKVEVKLKFNYILMPEEGPKIPVRIVRMTSILGREDQCDLIVDDKQVSRKHCVLEAWEQHVKVKDLGSSNGTYINGLPIRDGFLNTGDQLSLGSYKMILQKEQKKAPDMP